MSTVLYIKANVKPEGKSRTFKVSDAFVEEYKKLNPNDTIVTLDLYKEGIDFLRQEDVEMHVSAAGADKDHPVLKYAYQFVEADKYIVAAPLWNLSVPAILKAYIDYICITGITFKYTAEGPVGLCQGKKAVHIVGRGGAYSQGPTANFEMGDRYLRTLFGFLGIRDFTTIAAEMLDVIGVDANAVVEETKTKAIEAAKTF